MRSSDDVSAAQITEMPQARVGGDEETRPAKAAGCSRGKMRMGGKEYIIDCDGRIQKF